MKRSEINSAIRKALDMLGENHLRLPEFAYWSMEDWRDNREKLDNLRKIMLGWDVTDFGSGDFNRTGATLFTIRNGVPNDPTTGTPYAEKLIFMLEAREQEIPMHYHAVKTEDIINRGGGVLVLELFGAKDNGEIDRENEIHVKMDGIITTLSAGAVIEVKKGNSITLHPRLYHRFWAKKGCGDLIVGEVSSVNDDRTDNMFYGGIPRFASIEEDEAPICPLCNELEGV